MTPAERLREASARLREVAGKVDDDPWMSITVDDHITDYPWRLDGTFRNWRGERLRRDIARVATTDDAIYIATMHPGVALALADWLDHTASQVALFDATHDMEGSPLAGLMPRGAIDAIGRPALAVADAVLGGEQS